MDKETTGRKKNKGSGRKKTSKKKKVSDRQWNIVDGHLKRILDIEIRLEKVEADKDERINKAIAIARRDTEKLNDRKANYEKKLKEFVQKNEKLFDKRVRSRKLTWGRVGYRRSKKLVLLPGWTWDMVREELIRHSKSKFLKMFGKEGTEFIKVRREVNKMALRDSDLTPAELASFGVKIVAKDKPWYQVFRKDKTNVAEMDSGSKGE